MFDKLAKLAADYVVARAIGGKKAGKAALMSSALQGALGQEGGPLAGLFGTSKATGQGEAPPPPLQAGIGSREAAEATGQGARNAPDAKKEFVPHANTLGISKFLIDAGMDDQSKIVNMLNSPVGEALLFGLGGELLGGGGEEEMPKVRPFGGEGPPLNLNLYRDRVRQKAQGGYIDGQYFPRRNGGIMPSEGSGQQDDVPAMLMAGEFVLTKDAVKGLGNGDSNRGIKKAYAMMDQLEKRA